MTIVKGLPDPTWDTLVAEQGAHYLQSRAWAEFQSALGRTVLFTYSKDWSWLATLRQASGFKYIYSAYGPTLKKGAAGEALASLAEAARAQKASFVRLEPMGDITETDLQASGFAVRQIEEIEPAMTSVVTLTQDESTLRRELSSGHRNAINGASRRGVTIRERLSEADTDAFIRLIELTSQKANIRVHEAEYFRTMLRVLVPLKAVKLYVAEAEEVVVAATIIFTSPTTWYYAHAASDPAYLKLQAGVPLVWQAILDAKASGASAFDLWGVIPPGETQNAKAGYSKFKRAFGGQDKTFVGTWDLIVQPETYAVYKLGRQFVRIARKVGRG